MSKDKSRVLFLGNSHTYWNDTPAIFSQICKDCGKEVEVNMIAGPGVMYDGHLKQRINLRYALVYGNYEYMIMQQAAHTPLPETEDTIRGACEIADWAREYNVQPLQWVPFARTNKPEEQAGMYDIYNRVHEAAKIPLLPVGNMYEYIKDNYPEVQLIQTDGCHSSPYGSYLYALCTYAMIFDTDFAAARPVSIEYFGGKYSNNVELDPEKVDIIKKVVKEYFDAK